jgi:hypothetical protein
VVSPPVAGRQAGRTAATEIRDSRTLDAAVTAVPVRAASAGTQPRGPTPANHGRNKSRAASPVILWSGRRVPTGTYRVHGGRTVDHPATIYPPSHQAFLTSLKRVRFKPEIQFANILKYQKILNKENHAYVSTLHIKFREKLTCFAAWVKKTKKYLIQSHF